MIKKSLLLINKRIKYQILILLFFSFFVALLELLSLGSIPILVESLINYDQLLKKFEHLKIFDIFVNEIEKNQQIIYFASLIFLLFLLKNFIIIIYIFFEKLIVYKIRVLNSKKLYETLISDKFVNHLQKDISRINRNFLYDIDGACSVIEHFMIIFREILVLFALIFLLSFQDPIIFFSLLFFFIFFSLIYYFLLRGRIIRLSTIALENRKNKISFLNQTFKNFIIINLYNIKSQFKKKYVYFLKDTEKFKIFVNVITTITKPIFETLSFFFIILIVIYSFNTGVKETDLLTTITLLVVISYRMMPLINNLTNSFTKIKSKQVVLEEICKDIDKFNNLEISISNHKKFLVNDTIQIKNINYIPYKSKSEILKNLSFSIKKGEKIFIQGKTGSGKSTLLNIISGFLNPTTGSILVDNIDINKNIIGWQGNISYVEQKVFLFKDNLINNITMLENENKLNESLLNEIIKICHLEKLYDKRKNQIFDEDGLTVSGGEKQRIGLARAIYKNREVLILDEATNAINNEMEKLIFEKLFDLMKNKTIICVSHNLDNIKKFDKVIDIDKFS